jgi:hypothetical protein
MNYLIGTDILIGIDPGAHDYEPAWDPWTGDYPNFNLSVMEIEAREYAEKMEGVRRLGSRLGVVTVSDHEV